MKVANFVFQYDFSNEATNHWIETFTFKSFIILYTTSSKKLTLLNLFLKYPNITKSVHVHQFLHI